MSDISHFQRWSIYWYQDLSAWYLSLPALVSILVSGSLCLVALTSSVGLYIGIRIFVPDISHFQRWSIYWYQDLSAWYLSLPALVSILVSGSLCLVSLTSSVGLYIGIRISLPGISHFQRWSLYWYQDLCAWYLSLPALVYILVSGSLCLVSLTSSVGLYIGIKIFVPGISHFQRWSIYWYQDLCSWYLSLPALVYILVSGSLCLVSLTSSVGLYIGIRIFVPGISHFQRWSIYWYQDLCAWYLSLPALVSILVSGSLCLVSLTSSVGLYIGIRIFVPDISHFQRWSIYWYQDLSAWYLSLPVLVSILVSGSLCLVSLTSSVGLYIGIRISVPGISHFQRWSLYWYQDLCAWYPHFQRWSIYWYQDLCAWYLSLPALVSILVSGSLCLVSLTSSVGLYIGIKIFVPGISHFQRWSIYWYQDLSAWYLSLPALVSILVSGSLCLVSLSSRVGLYIGIRISVPGISHFQHWSIYWYQDLCARYLSVPALIYILVSRSLCLVSLTSSVGLYIGIRIFVPDISHFQRWSIYWYQGLYIGIRIFVPDISHFQHWYIYWYQDLCARYLSLPALVYILVSGSLCLVSLTSSVGLYIGIRISVPGISHFQRWSIYWYQDLCARYLSLPALVYILICAGFVLF